MNRSKCLALASALFGTLVGLPAYSATPTYTMKLISAGAVHHGAYSLPMSRLKYSTSGNWSGFGVPYYKSGIQDTFTVVQGAWQVPVVTGGKTPLYSSAWIGLDGYNDGTVEQTGTEQDWDGKQQQGYVWFEMFPNYAFSITGFPLNPGDIMWGQVQYLGSVAHSAGTPEYVFQITIINLTQNVGFVIPTNYTTMPVAPGLSSAEWIMEAPFFNEILPLANFGQALFADCQAVGIGAYSASRGGAGVLEPIDFWPIDPLTMQDPEGGKSTPSTLTDSLEPDGTTSSAFDVTYTAK
ncbi:MAG TPA: G1 family glutamic endopeptidase [Opitutaceae bacterium]|jgi:hypothetical protein